MQPRIAPKTFYQKQPTLTQALRSIGEQAVADGLEPTLIHLVKLRVSQINHCAFCQHMHANEARKDGESQARLDILPAWRETPYFSAQERAALAWAEALTLQSQGGVSDQQFEQARAELGEDMLLSLTAVVIAINGWNRVAVGLGFVPVIT